MHAALISPASTQTRALKGIQPQHRIVVRKGSSQITGCLSAPAVPISMQVPDRTPARLDQAHSISLSGLSFIANGDRFHGRTLPTPRDAVGGISPQPPGSLVQELFLLSTSMSRSSRYMFRV